MKQTIDFQDFRDAFRAHDRMDNFSHEGQRVLFDYLEELYPDYELDVIALCCDYAEDSPEDIAANYDIDISGADGDTDAINDIVREYLENETLSFIVGETSHGFVYAQF